MNTKNEINQNVVKVGDQILVFQNNQWVKRKVLKIETHFSGATCYIVNFKYGSNTVTGRVYTNEIKLIN